MIAPAVPFPVVVFDLDGTLLQSVPSLTRTLNVQFAEDGIAPLSEAEVGLMVGEGVGLLVARAYGARGIGGGDIHDPGHAARLARFSARYNADPVTDARVYPGAVETLRALKDQGIRLGLCTNKPEAPTLVLIEATGLAPFLDVVVGGDTLPRRKPDPLPLRHVLDHLGATPDQALYVGDSPTDAACAQAAGVTLALLSHGYSRVPVETLGAKRVFDSLPALARWVTDGAGD
ncbi:phosphoglycolate phosphatase [Pararhodospirillum oryzae]|uniref:Phosphoglycolate phosphatase n=1 Tax=Pararhodospirillum oryzae TaxID=478448 RepID=A0A512H5W3_9PROT|nr:phosphoglycolate phosphatase [Pararhodospirillum oryzae]GEO80770.1 phosphoglycolate phosphatase [Pararhodospirillum oryzae]